MVIDENSFFHLGTFDAASDNLAAASGRGRLSLSFVRSPPFTLMTDRRSLIGTLVSITWIALGVFLLVRDPVGVAKMTPNDWGSFLSGAFAPLGFLWLVLGYLQQGEDLKLSTHALTLQAEELKNSVEQQRALVEVSRLQVESEREALAYERGLREETSKPLFTVAGSGGSFRGDGESSYNFLISNTGHDATGFVAEMQLVGETRRRVFEVPLFNKGAQHRISVTHLEPLPGAESRLFLRYTDGLGKPCESTYIVQRVDESAHAELQFTRIEV